MCGCALLLHRNSFTMQLNILEKRSLLQIRAMGNKNNMQLRECRGFYAGSALLNMKYSSLFLQAPHRSLNGMLKFFFPYWIKLGKR